MNIPTTIYLQICPEHGIDCKEEITWCVDRINDTDVEYQLVNVKPAKESEPKQYSYPEPPSVKNQNRNGEKNERNKD